MTMVSVIVPVYNNTYYLKDCVDSILAQTYPEIELILVDDGSDEECASLCDLYKDTASVYHKKNGGVSSARNFGLERASGEYVCFVDSDDIVSPLYIETLVEMCLKNNVSIAACSLKKTFNETIDIPTAVNSHNEYLFSGEDRWRPFFQGEHSVGGYSCNKIFKKDLIRDIRFDETLVQNEDIVFVAQVVKNSQNIIVTDDVLYYYRQNPFSAMAHLNSTKFENALSSVYRISAILEGERVSEDILQKGKDYLASWNMLYARYLCRTKPTGWYKRFLSCRKDFLQNNQASPDTGIFKTEYKLIRDKAAFIVYQTLKALKYNCKRTRQNYHD